MRSWLPALLAALALSAACEEKKLISGFPDSFVGVGIELRVEERLPVVVRTLPGGSAAEAGILPGDKLTKIDAFSTEGMSLGDVVMRLRGAPGTQVSCTLIRNDERHIFVIRRRRMTKSDAGYSPTP